MFTRQFAKRTAERAIKTFVQVFGAAAGLGAPGLSVLDIDWPTSASLGAAAALASLAMSIMSAPFSPAGSPSIVD